MKILHNNAFKFLILVAMSIANISAAEPIKSSHMALEEIVVTATRRSESLQDVPIAISAFTGEQLEKSGIVHTGDLSMSTPNLTFGVRGAGYTVFIRGIGGLGISAGDENSVATYIDGVYQSNPYTSAMSFNSVERIEVIKGPQGTLYGRNATGGLINVVTKEPGYELEGIVSLTYDNYDTVGAKLYLGGPVSETLSADISLVYENQGEGFGDNVFTGNELQGNEDTSVRSKWVYRPSDETKITFIADYSDLLTSNGPVNSLVPGSVGADLSTSLPNHHDVQANIDPLYELDLWRTSLTFRHTFKLFEFVSTTAYSDYESYFQRSNDSVPTRIVDVRANYASETLTQEFQLLSNNEESNITWILGAFFLEDDAQASPPLGTHVSGFAFVPSGIGGLNYIASLETSSQSIFGEATLALTDKTDLTVGARYTRDKKTFVGRTDFIDLESNLLFSSPEVNAEKTFSEPTWRIILDHELTDQVMVYGSYSKGFKGGTYNTVEITGNAIDPEIVDAFEVGFKGNFLENRLSVNFAAFFYDYEDIQLPISNGTTQVTINAANSEIKGIDLDINWLLTDQLTATIGFGYLDAVYEDFQSAPCTGRNAAGFTVGFQCDASGKDLVQAPNSQFNIGLNYTLPTNLGTYDFNILYSRTDEFYWDVDNRLKEDAYGLLNAQIRLTPSANENMTFFVYGRNITDEEYTVQQFAQPGLGDSFSAAKPAQYGIGVDYRF